MSKEWVSHCLGNAIKDSGRPASVFSRTRLPAARPRTRRSPGLFSGAAFGRTWLGPPAAMGASLACPDRLVFATVGDGSYMFANPTAATRSARHWTSGHHPGPEQRRVGRGASLGGRPLQEWACIALERCPTDFTSTEPRFLQDCRSQSRAHGNRQDGAELPAALDRAIRVATEEKRQCLLNIAIKRTSP